MRPLGRAAFQSADILPHLIQQESGGRAGISGPQTQWGQAQGLAQVLPATAQGIAKRLGVPYRADLMTGTSEAAKQYQSAIGQAYLDEALDKTGNVSDALKYYHGGPNRRMWGPKTEAYANAIVSRLDQQPGPQADPKDAAYQKWLSRYHIRPSDDYDTRAAFDSGMKPSENGHLGDTYKLPNHMTFSDESKYSSGSSKGGQWIEQRHGSWAFKASPFNLQQHSRQQFMRYFDDAEPGNTVIFPDGTRYTGKRR